MCNLYTLTVTRDEFGAYFRANDDWRREVGRDSGEVYPGDQAYVVRDAAGERMIDVMRWGFPTRAPRKRAPKEGQSPYVTTWWTNARNIANNMWRPTLSTPGQRCLVPFTRFAEPKAAADRRDAGDRNWWFTVKDQPIPCFAGLWKTDPVEGPVFSFLTTEPNPLVAPKHPKAMPVILLADDHDRWLAGDFAAAQALQAPYPSQMMAIAP